MSSSDKILFAMKQFKMEMDPVNLYKKADPLVVSKLDINSVKNYNFPRVNMADVRRAMEGDKNHNVTNEDHNIVKKMIELAKDSVARQIIDKRD